ncbi:hypothetical protein TNIN_68011 [Trichonephila inaurata madagascariensis]|uniref:Uncharacterized protein n=1 Tax=Trichonephila inaurata madagascariensis TaxID=2747483 RepID=A0A8X6X3A3_9ARAC|nr:hypothetical protein TNIN_68011 [Trichonephila inaurata madagascariensis]
MDFETRRKKVHGWRSSFGREANFFPIFFPALSSLSCFRFLLEKRGGTKMVKPKTLEYFLEYLLPESTRASTPPQGLFQESLDPYPILFFRGFFCSRKMGEERIRNRSKRRGV